MNFSEAIPDITASYSYNYLDPDLFLTVNDSPYQECGDLMKNPNNKKIESSCTNSSYPSPVDVKKVSDKSGTSYSKGMDEPFTSSPLQKRVTWGPSTVYPLPSSHFQSHKCDHKEHSKTKSTLFGDDNMVILLTFVFMLYLIYSLITLRLELDHVKKVLDYQQMLFATGGLNIMNR